MTIAGWIVGILGILVILCGMVIHGIRPEDEVADTQGHGMIWVGIVALIIGGLFWCFGNNVFKLN